MILTLTNKLKSTRSRIVQCSSWLLKGGRRDVACNLMPHEELSLWLQIIFINVVNYFEELSCGVARASQQWAAQWAICQHPSCQVTRTHDPRAPAKCYYFAIIYKVQWAATRKPVSARITLISDHHLIRVWNEIFNLIRGPCRKLTSSLLLKVAQNRSNKISAEKKSVAHQNVKQWMKINKRPNFACQKQSANEPNIPTLIKIKTKNGIILSVHWMRPVLNFYNLIVIKHQQCVEEFRQEGRAHLHS